MPSTRVLSPSLMTSPRLGRRTGALALAVMAGAHAGAQPASLQAITAPGAGRLDACALSADGRAVIGLYIEVTSIQVFRWTAAGGVQLLGPPPFSQTPVTVSADGSVILAPNWRWSTGGGFETSLGASATGMAADGGMAVGFVTSQSHYL